MSQNFNKVFKTPKYTGVTLALLSMFVLACMMAVWNKLSLKTTGENHSSSLRIVCDEKLEVIIRPTIQSFFSETGFNSIVSFVSSDELESLISENNKSKVFIVSPKSTTMLHALDRENFFDEIIIGYHPPDSTKEPNQNIRAKPIKCLIGKDIENLSHAFALSRYMKSPDRGHLILEENGFIPSEGDEWQITPSVIVYATPELRESLRIPLADFSEREGIKIELNIKSQASIEKTVSLIAQSKAKQYLPDVLFGYSPDSNIKNLYSYSKDKFLEKRKLCYVSKSSKVSYTCKRMVLGAVNYFNE